MYIFLFTYIELWDTVGHELYSTIPRNFYRQVNLFFLFIFLSPLNMFFFYYRDVHGAILMYDVNNKNTFNKLYVWIEELETYSTKPNLVKMMIGNKIDMPVLRQVPHEKGLIFAKANHAMFAETSAKNNVGVNDAMENLVRKILATENLWESTSSRLLKRDSIKLLKDQVQTKPDSSSLNSCC